MKWKKTGLLVWCAVFLLLTGTGCVYVRLLSLKSQLADFTKHLKIEDREGPTVVFKEPILKNSDILWLFGFYPSEVEDDTEEFVFRKVRERQSDQLEHDDMVLTFGYEKKRLKTATMPKRFAPFITEEYFLEIFSPLKDMGSPEKNKSAAWNWADMKVLIPNRDRLKMYLGPPTEFSKEADKIVMVYQYTLDGPKEEKAETPALEFIFHLDPKTTTLRYADARMGRIDVKVKVTRGNNHVVVKRGKRE